MLVITTFVFAQLPSYYLLCALILSIPITPEITAFTIIVIYVDFLFCCNTPIVVDYSRNSTYVGCNRLAFTQLLLDFIRSEEKPKLLPYLLVL